MKKNISEVVKKQLFKGAVRLHRKIKKGKSSI